MVTVTEWKIVLERWKKGMRPFQDQKYGQTVVQMLEKYTGNELGLFDDPYEAATIIILIGLMKEQEKRRWRPPFQSVTSLLRLIE